jgi:hypothetical protein
MGAHRNRKLSAAIRERIERVWRWRKALPTDKELAKEAGVTPFAIRRYMDRLERQEREARNASLVAMMPANTDTESGIIPAAESSDDQRQCVSHGAIIPR